MFNACYNSITKSKNIFNYIEMVKLIYIMPMGYIAIYRFSNEFLQLNSEIHTLVS